MADESDDTGATPQDWDATDPRRQRDCFAPPIEPCECGCLHCRRTFGSDQIWLQRIVNGEPGEIAGFWMCPTPNCDGKGFTFDIFPTDPDHPANAGWTYCDVDEESGDAAFGNADGPALDEPDGDDFIEDGDEWKLGIRPDEAGWPASGGNDGDPDADIPYTDEELAAREARQEAEQARYDMPDERPRVIDASILPPRPDLPADGEDGEIKDWDIPF